MSLLTLFGKEARNESNCTRMSVPVSVSSSEVNKMFEHRSGLVILTPRNESNGTSMSVPVSVSSPEMNKMFEHRSGLIILTPSVLTSQITFEHTSDRVIPSKLTSQLTSSYTNTK